MLTTGVFVTREDKGLKDIAEVIKALNGRIVTAGVQGPAAARKYDNGTTVAEAAVYNEFGTQDIPARSFIRSTAFEKRADIKAALVKELRRVIKDPAGVTAALGRAGAQTCDMIRAKLDSSKSWAKPNAPGTVAQKGSDRPLNDTGQLRDAIAWEVQSKGGQPLGRGK